MITTPTTLGIVDYGVGNHASVANCMKQLGFRVHLSADPEKLSTADILILPGVGAFPSAMEALRNKNLDKYLQVEAQRGRPIIGICLGMQLLTNASYEHHYTEGLKLIPGEIVPLEGSKWHIGWNSIQNVQPKDKVFASNNEQVYYFNHSYCYKGPEEYQICQTTHGSTFACVIRKNNIVGIQFHPEKSQAAGLNLLKQLILDLVHA